MSEQVSFVIEQYDNKTLAEANEQFALMIVQLKAENDKLRELVRDMWRFTGAACKKYPRLFDPPTQGPQTVQFNPIETFEQRMQELGVCE